MKTLKPAIVAGFIFLIQTAFAQSISRIVPAAERTGEYFPLLVNKKVALVGNQTSMIGQVHLLDSLISIGIKVIKIFSPEHGFRGNADAGEKISNATDSKTGIRIISLYGRNHKPKRSDLSDVDIILFDIQDVGVRFYTYISTLHYVMEACAEDGKPLIVLDRPNPNGFYIDGPLLDLKYRSFVGLHPVPVVYGMTIGEYALMINGEKWLKNGVQCNLTVIKCTGYTHKSRYVLPVKPSPNLPDMQAVYFYPSLGLFEGTAISIGRGTNFPFQVFGHPQLSNMQFTFVPEATPGTTEPLYKGQTCYGVDLRNFKPDNDSDLFTLKWLIYAYKNFPDKTNFFNTFFRNLSGNNQLQNQIIQGMTESEIKKSWKQDIDKFKNVRSKYLIYQ
jgi:uncharacterized protein YbbC (DUF1343 family)